MARGAFTVARYQDDARDIHFRVRDPEVDEIPEEQATLRDEVDRALTVLRGLFKEGDPRFEKYFGPLLALAQAGLVGPAAQPAVSMRALRVWKSDIVSTEGGRIKNGYMLKLGRAAAALGLPALLVALALSNWVDDFDPLNGFLFLWSGCMAGVWLSFGARKVVLAFDELHILEEDRLEPVIRLVFAGMLTLLIGLLFHTGAMAITVGSLQLQSFAQEPAVALLLGGLTGFSETTLSGKVADQAAAFLNLSRT